MTNKYGARRVQLDGFTFDSRREAARYEELRMLEMAGEIRGLEVHPEYRLWVAVQPAEGFATNVGVLHRALAVGKYTPDFRYLRADGEVVVEDVKGGTATRTEAFRLRKRMVEATYGLVVTEVT